MSKVTFRPGGKKDAQTIAQLHIKSWQNSYRGILTDAFLDEAIVADRISFWTQRLVEEPGEHTYLLIAEQDGKAVGFVCAIIEEHESWGTLIDNLHVLSSAQGLGLGRELMRKAAGWIKQQDEGGDMYLWVYKENRQARAFYEKIGGNPVEERVEKQPDGFDAPIVRYHWASPLVVL